MVGISTRDRGTNEWIHLQTKVPDVIKIVNMKWKCHITRGKNLGWTTKI